MVPVWLASPITKSPEVEILFRVVCEMSYGPIGRVATFIELPATELISWMLEPPAFMAPPAAPPMAISPEVMVLVVSQFMAIDLLMKTSNLNITELVGYQWPTPVKIQMEVNFL